MKNQKIILASSSPRRQEILNSAGFEFRVVKSDFEEDMSLKMRPPKLAKYLSWQKALDTALKYPNDIVIGADTFVVFKDKIMGKPKSKKEARSMLATISGKTVKVLSAFTIIKKSRKKTCITETEITFKKLTKKEIDDYIKTEEPMDKAGAFAIQGRGAVFIKKIKGDWFGAVGISVFLLNKELKKFCR